MPATDTSLHEYAIELARQYRHAEGLLLKALDEIDSCKLFRVLGYSSLFTYAVSTLGLSEAVASAMITIARKARDVAPLRAAVWGGELTVNKAAKIVSVVVENNIIEMIAFAKTHTSREIESEVARRRASGGANEKMRNLPIPASLFEKLKRAQSVMSTKRGKNVDRLEVLEAVLDQFLERHDPVRQADRAMKRSQVQSQKAGSGQSNSARTEFAKPRDSVGAEIRTPLDSSRAEFSKSSAPSRAKSLRQAKSAAEIHAVNARDRGRCQFIDANGKRCENDRWLHHHHKIPVSHGGTSDPENLVSLCSFHHDLVQQLSLGQAN